ncbi:MAG: hypothetical protein IPK65_00300 [Gammaproteobacteria bacterium]|nr:hypothetical protein [Gammaproteobacteria bacterium]
MNTAVHVLIVSIFTIPFLSKTLGILPRIVSLLPEVISGALLIAALLRAAHFKKISIKRGYIVLFSLFCLHIMLGAILNGEQPGTFLSGLRNYLKYAPLFLVPAVYDFKDKEIASQFHLLLFLGLSQFPFVIYQKFVEGKHADLVAGTLGVGSVMSIYLVCLIAILLGYYFRSKLSTGRFLSLVFLLFIPTTLNETKSILIFFPAAFLVVMALSGISRDAKIRIIGAGASFCAMLGTFFLVYSLFFSADRERGLLDFFLDPETGVKFYLYSGDSQEIDAKRVLDQNQVIIGALPTVDRDEDKIRRIDNIILPIRVLSEDPVKLLVGLGIGNASDSFISSFSGKYSQLGSLDSSYTALSIFLWEIGLIGVLIFFLFFYMIFHDAKSLSGGKEFIGNFSVGWASIAVIIALSIPYKNFLTFDVLGYLFFYYSGYVAAKSIDQSVNYDSQGSRN